MAISACPSCGTNLKVPDGTVATVRCPKCQTVFQSKPSVAGAAPPSRPVSPKPAPPEFEVVNDEPRRQSSRRDCDDRDDDRPRRSRRDDDDDDDRPRSRKRDRDDDRDDDRRPAKRKKRRSDDFDDDDLRSGSVRRSGGGGAGRTGALILSIAFWCDVALYGFLTLLAIIFWASRDVPAALGLIVGPLRAFSWLLGLVGIGFCIAGPERARKLAIAAASLAGLHILLLLLGFFVIGVSIADLNPNRPPPPPPQFRQMQVEPERAPFTIQEVGAFGYVFALGTSIVPAEISLPVLIYGSKAGGGKVVSNLILFLLASACDIARLILSILMLRAMAESAKSFEASDKLRIGVGGVSIICGAAILVTTFVAILVVEGEMAKAARHLLSLTALALMLCYCLMMVFPALGALQVAGAFKKRKR
ncbi:MAG TPA: hypothetical protein VN641_07780 [Urbifossiella sp.]|nr:hypothetical protein [Urbifossiella sp.]